jgi:hypothetical protein
MTIIPTKSASPTPTPALPIRNNLPRLGVLALVGLLWLLLGGFLLVLLHRSRG